VLPQVGPGHWSYVRAVLHGIAHLEPAHLFDETGDKLVRNVLVQDEALGRDAALSVVDHSREHSRRESLLHVRAGHYDKGIAAPQFQHGLLDALARVPGDGASGANTASKGRALDAGIIENARHALG